MTKRRIQVVSATPPRLVYETDEMRGFLMSLPLTEKEKEIVWRGWRRGLTHDAIAQQVGKTGVCVFLHLQMHGGIKPPKRARRADALTLDERLTIANGLRLRQSLRQIAVGLGRSPSTISREIKRNSWRRGYDAIRGDKAAWRRACRPRPSKLDRYANLRELVTSKLAADWSPEQIAGWLKRHYAGNEEMTISYESIYKCLYTPTRNVLGKEALRQLRTGRRLRRSRTKTQKGGNHSAVHNGTPITKRPPEAAVRSEPGHWEGDLVTGNHGSYVATLVDRKTRFTLLIRLAGKEAGTVTSALCRRMQRLPESLKKSLTWDRGAEMSKYESFTQRTGVPVYFCAAGSPWQRGSNENTNGLLRQYLPKSHSFSHLSQRQLNALAEKLNTRPKKVLNYSTPKLELQKSVALMAQKKDTNGSIRYLKASN